MHETVIAGVNEGADIADKLLKQPDPEEAKIAARLAATQQNAASILFGLQILQNLPGSNFTFEPHIRPHEVFVETNVTEKHSPEGRAYIVIKGTSVKAFGFSKKTIEGTTPEPGTFLKTLASALAERQVVPRQPGAKINTPSPRLNA
ncbi:MAG: hypothetical protein WCD70_03620 [Alphaproteobacteria bacterium]